MQKITETQQIKRVPKNLRNCKTRASIEDAGYEADNGESDMEPLNGDDTERETPPPMT